MNSGRNQVIAALAEAIFPALHDDASFARLQGDEKLANFLETGGRSLEIFTAEARPLVSLERSPKAIAKPDQRGASAVPGHLSRFQIDARTYHSIVNSHQNFSTHQTVRHTLNPSDIVHAGLEWHCFTHA